MNSLRTTGSSSTVFTDEELEVLEVALICYRNQLAADAVHEPMGSITGQYTSEGERFVHWAFVAQDLMLKLGIDPAEDEYSLEGMNSAEEE